jgi:hypothetical protein
MNASGSDTSETGLARAERFARTAANNELHRTPPALLKTLLAEYDRRGAALDEARAEMGRLLAAIGGLLARCEEIDRGTWSDTQPPAGYIATAEVWRAFTTPSTPAEPITDLIERSSLGTPEARAARARVSDEQAQAVLDRVAAPARPRPSCPACGEPIDVAEPHVTVLWHIETEDDGETYVHDAQVLSQMHPACVPLTPGAG